MDHLIVVVPQIVNSKCGYGTYRNNRRRGLGIPTSSELAQSSRSLSASTADPSRMMCDPRKNRSSSDDDQS